MTDDIPAALKRDKDNVAPFMRALEFHGAVSVKYDENGKAHHRPNPATSPPASPPSWVPPWQTK